MLDNFNENSAMQARYQRSEELMQGIWNNKFVLNGTVFPTWIAESDCFWYEREAKASKEYRLVNANAETNQTAFDHHALASALSDVAKQEVSEDNLPLNKVAIDLDLTTLNPVEVCFDAFGKRWRFDIASAKCVAINGLPQGEIVSPNGRYSAFLRDYNLWIRDEQSNQEHALTKDGEEFFVYAITGDAWGGPIDSGLQIKWSPDSRRIFTVQRDTRQVKTLPVVHHVPQDHTLRPTVEHIKIAYPGDEHIPEYRLLAIDVESATIKNAHYPTVPVGRNGWGFFGKAGLGWWAADSKRAYFVDQGRGEKIIRVVEFDTNTGATRILFEETSDTHINVSVNSEDYPPFFPIPETNELVWWSERSGWAHLYLYDLNTGALKNTISNGHWQVRDVIHFDAKRREVFVQTAGRVEKRDPYYRDLVRINIDIGEINELISSDHEIVTVSQKGEVFMFAYGRDVEMAGGVSPSGEFAVITRSRADELPVSLLVDRNGREVLELEAANIPALPNNWQWPEPVKLVAADGETDIYGLVFRPSDFSPEQSYPVISHVFNTPEIHWVSKGSFTNGVANGWPYLDAAALAELGFIVVQIDGRGTTYRHKAFHDECYGWFESASKLEDHVAGIQQLAERYNYMDLSRVGITAHTTGGSGGVQGLLQYPDFYKVGVQTMFHDSRLMPGPMMGDKYEGVSGPAPDHKYPEALAENLQGKLLLTGGMLDYITPPATMFRLVEALQKANKDFDMVLLPNVGHACSSYLIRRAWDYLVRHLQEVDPPRSFKLTSVWDRDFYSDIFENLQNSA